MQVTSTSLLAALANLIATGAEFDHAAVFLGAFTSITDRGARTALSDLTLAPGTLATAVVLGAWGSPYLLQNGSAVADNTLHDIRGASSADDCTVIGWYWATLATAGSLISFGYLPSPVILTYPNSNLGIVPRLVLDAAGVWDASVVFDG